MQLSNDEITELGHARNIVAAAVHPDTQKVIPMAMRITFFMPMNIPISMGFLFSAPTMRNTVFWQVVNQTYNAVMNFGNANKSSPVTHSDILKSYGMALGASVSASIGFRLLTAKQTATAKGAKLAVINAVVSIVACASGGFVNNWFMRQPETVKGIEIADPANMESVGKSCLAAKEAVKQTAVSRIFLAAPVGIPGFILFAMERKGLVPKNAALMLML